MVSIITSTSRRVQSVLHKSWIRRLIDNTTEGTDVERIALSANTTSHRDNSTYAATAAPTATSRTAFAASDSAKKWDSLFLDVVSDVMSHLISTTTSFADVNNTPENVWEPSRETMTLGNSSEETLVVNFAENVTAGNGNVSDDALRDVIGVGLPSAGGRMSPLLLGFTITQPILMAPMFLCNLVVLLVYWRYLGFRQLTNVFVFNISVSDFCMSFNMLVQMIFFLRADLSDSEQACMFRMELMTFLTSVSLLSGVFATLDRYVAVCAAPRYGAIMSTRTVRALVALVWIYSFAFAAVPFFANNWSTSPKCEFVTVVPAWFILWGSSQHVLATVTEVLLYAAIFHTARMRARNFGHEPHSGRPEQNLRGAKFMGVVLVVYSLCWTPFAVLGFVQVLSYHPSLTYVRMSTVYLGLSNSLVNPLVYAWQRRDFRQGCRKLLGCRPTLVHPAVNR